MHLNLDARLEGKNPRTHNEINNNFKKAKIKKRIKTMTQRLFELENPMYWMKF